MFRHKKHINLQRPNPAPNSTPTLSTACLIRTDVILDHNDGCMHFVSSHGNIFAPCVNWLRNVERFPTTKK